MKINEFSKLYDVTPHTLRYYEKIGLLPPDYAENGYRKYSYTHMEIMNIIRDLRYFNIPLPEIKRYLREKNLTNTKELFEFQIQCLENKINTLQDKKQHLHERLSIISEAECSHRNKPYITEYPKRGIIKSEKQIISSDIDFELKVLHKEFEEFLCMGNQNSFGSTLSLGNDQIIYQVFYFCACESAEKIEQGEVLEQGKYLCYCFEGEYSQTNYVVKLLKELIIKYNLRPMGPFRLIYLVDFHQTNHVEEFFTRIEILVDAL